MKWDGKSRLPVAIFVDVDGALVGPYRDGGRRLRSTAVEALALLAKHAPVFIWSIGGVESGRRVLIEHPEIGKYVSGVFGKDNAPVDLVDRAYAIDDDDIDDVVRRLRHVVLPETYDGGEDTGSFLEAARLVVEDLTTGPEEVE